MFAFKTFENFFSAKDLFPHQVTALRAFLVYRFEVGDEFTLRIIFAAEEFTASAFSLLKLPSTFRAGDRQLFRRCERFGIFTFWISRTGKEFSSFGILDDHGRTALLAFFIGLFGLLYFGSVSIFGVFAFREITAGDEFTVAAFPEQ